MSDYVEAAAPPKPFGQSFKEARKSMGLTQAKAAEVLEVVTETVQRWEAGKWQPPALVQTTYIRKILTTNRRPSPKARASAARHHHLYLDKCRGWIFRCTISRGPTLKGMRVKRTLGTKSLRKALEAKKLLIAEWQALGLKVILKHQRPKKKNTATKTKV